MDKKYILVGCGGSNSEIKNYIKEWYSFKDCYKYVRNEVKNERMGDGGIRESKEEDWIMWERESYILELTDGWRKDIKLNEKDIGVIGYGDESIILVLGEKNEWYNKVDEFNLDSKEKEVDFSNGKYNEENYDEWVEFVEGLVDSINW